MRPEKETTSSMKTKHMLLMLVCCLVPLIGLGAAFLFHLPFSTLFTAAMIVFCPLSHVVMMYFMMRGHHDQPEHGQHAPAVPPAPPLFPEPRETR